MVSARSIRLKRPMFFASPIWLALLLPPWAAAAVWLMWSRRGERTNVPFIELWRDGTAESPREKRQFRPPPIALIAALAAVLLAIIASARPKLEVGSAGEGPLVTVVLDRGVTMAAGDRIAEVIAAARPVVLEAFGEGPTDLVEVPKGTSQRVNRSAWSQVASRATPTQEQTRDAVQFAVQQALAKTDGPIVVLSDQPIRDDPRVVQIAPSKPLQNVAIEKFVVRESPRPQAMVTVVNYSDQPRATVRVRSGERTLVERAIDLPRAPGGEATVFLDLPSLDSSAVAEIEAADDLAIDNIAHAKRQRSFPSIEVRAPVPAEVRRVAEAYAKARSAHQTSVTIAIVDENSIASDFPIAIVSTSAASGGGGAVIVAAHPVSAGVDWADAKLQAADVPPGENWRAIVSVGGRGVVAVRESPQRQV
ncbi:MAG: hypothetical protein QOE14_2395, partial [Humisphaera sp.]|nr:hypothetical protein [Humisphaera sp.]